MKKNIGRSKFNFKNTTNSQIFSTLLFQIDSMKKTLATLFLIYLFVSCHNYGKIRFVKADKKEIAVSPNRNAIEKIEIIDDSSSLSTSEENVTFQEPKEKSFILESIVSSLNLKTDNPSEIFQPLIAAKKEIKERKRTQNTVNQQNNTSSNQLPKVTENRDAAWIVFVLLLIILIVIVFTLLFLWLVNVVVDDLTSSCYIATMAYGDNNAPEVITLRSFRDKYLVKNNLGRRFIRWYYKHSPGFVERHQSKLWLHKFCRYNLNILVFFLRGMFKLN